MRVCMFVYNPLDHDARVFREAGSLAAQGHTVDVIGWRHDGGVGQEERDGFTIHRVLRNPVNKRVRALGRLPGDAARKVIPGFRKMVPPPHERRAAKPGYLPNPQKQHSLAYRELMLRDYLKRAFKLAAELPDADVYHAHDLNTLPAAARAAKRAGAKLVYDSHELYLERTAITPMEKRRWQKIEQRLIGDADRVITVCDPIADELAKRYGIERPLVLLNCPDLSEPVGEGGAEKLRAKADLNGTSDPIVLYQGRIQPERGLESLVEAAKSLDSGVVVMLGQGNAMRRLQETIDAGHLSDRVRLAGSVPAEELPTLTSGAAVGVAPIEGTSLNYYWAAPNKLFEYMAAGLPVVASRLPVMAKVVEEHEVGLLYESGDAKGLADAINRLLGDRELYERLRANALAASKIFNWEQESKKLLGLYDELAASILPG